MSEPEERLLGGLASSRIVTAVKNRRVSGVGVYFTNKNIIIARNDKTGRAASDSFNRKIILGITGFFLAIIIGMSSPVFSNAIFRIFLIFICIGGALWLSDKFSNVIVDREAYPLASILKNQIDNQPLVLIQSVEIYHSPGLMASSQGGAIKIRDTDNRQKVIVVSPLPDEGEFQIVRELIHKTIPANLIQSKI